MAFATIATLAYRFAGRARTYLRCLHDNDEGQHVARTVQELADIKESGLDRPLTTSIDYHPI